MGNGASSNNNVKPISISRDDNHGREEQRPATANSAGGNALSKDLEVKELTRKLDESEVQRKLAVEEADKSKEEVAQLGTQVSDLESTILDLNDQIQLLEERLDQAYRKNVITEEKGCEGTLQIKDQYIKKLEDETKKVQNEINKLKLKSRKKLRAVNIQLAETKQDSSLKMFEMKDEIARLVEENKKLNEQGNSKVHEKVPGDSLSASQTDDGRTRIILQLSQQISEQNTKITALETSMVEKESTIKNLNVSHKPVNNNANVGEESLSSSLKMSPRNSSGLQKMGTFLTEESQSESGSRGPSPTELLYGTTDSQTLFNRVSGEMDELKAIAREMSALKKKKKKKTPVQKQEDSNAVSSAPSNSTSPVQNGSSPSEVEKRQWSSVSRDSGYENDANNSASGNARRRRRERFTQRLNSAGRQISATSQVSTVANSDIVLDTRTDRFGSGVSYRSDTSKYDANDSDLVDLLYDTKPIH